MKFFKALLSACGEIGLILLFGVISIGGLTYFHPNPFVVLGILLFLIIGIKTMQNMGG